MSEEMRRIEDDYVGRLRRGMKGITSDVVDDVEREIRAHIEDALAAREAPTVGALLDVLDRLGAPEEYARDLGLYAMVDRGYREWSVPLMFRSTAFWALSTVAGAVAVLAFGLLYAASLAVTGAGLMRLWQDLAPASYDLRYGRSLPGAPTSLALPGGGLALVGLTMVVRWFVAQYVHSARPHTLGGRNADHAWVERTSRRIVVTAVMGLATSLLAGFASGAYGLRDLRSYHLPQDYLGSPLALLSGVGLLVFLLAPVLGLLWTAAFERGQRAARES